MQWCFKHFRAQNYVNELWYKHFVYFPQLIWGLFLIFLNAFLLSASETYNVDVKKKKIIHNVNEIKQPIVRLSVDVVTAKIQCLSKRDSWGSEATHCRQRCSCVTHPTSEKWAHSHYLGVSV